MPDAESAPQLIAVSLHVRAGADPWGGRPPPNNWGKKYDFFCVNS